jgi:excinuclease ABC subunit A
LKPLQDVGLGYIKLGQSSSTLSGGENQRVKLAYYLGEEKSEATLFIFDEPTTGLHFHDIKTLLRAFNALIERGHTVLVIEHNMEVIKCADISSTSAPKAEKPEVISFVKEHPKELPPAPNHIPVSFSKRSCR